MAAHLVAAGTLVDHDPDAALAHARAARDRASRVAAVREAVGVAAYHAGDYAEAARELRAYRRMSGDRAYRAVLADCERALGRPEVALRLVAEALTESPDAEELAELRLVEAGARRDLGEHAAARLVLEAALGGRPTPGSLTEGDDIRLRFAAAYADLLRAEGEEELAEQWSDAVAALDPRALAESVEFTDLEELADDVEPDPGVVPDPVAELAPDAELDDAEAVEAAIEAEFGATSSQTSAESDAAGAFPTTGASFQDEIEAEVAELLGETGTGGGDEGPADDGPVGSTEH